MYGDYTNGQKKSNVVINVYGGTEIVETSGVYIPTGLGNFDKYDNSLFCGTLHPQPFIFVKFVKIKSLDKP